MPRSKEETAAIGIPYNPLPPDNQNVIVLTVYSTHRRPPYYRRCLLFLIPLLLISAAAFLLFPSDPSLTLSRIELNNMSIITSPKVTLDLSLSLTFKIRNSDFFSLDYHTLTAKVGYRGRELGVVRSQGGIVRARGSSYVNATLDLDGLEIVHDVIYLIEDLARGVIPFDTDTRVDGDLGLLFFTVPIKARVLCEVYVNTDSQEIDRQDCHPA